MGATNGRPLAGLNWRDRSEHKRVASTSSGVTIVNSRAQVSSRRADETQLELSAHSPADSGSLARSLAKTKTELNDSGQLCANEPADWRAWLPGCLLPMNRRRCSGK